MSIVAQAIQAEKDRVDSLERAEKARQQLEEQHIKWLIDQLRPTLAEFNAQEYQPVLTNKGSYTATSNEKVRTAHWGYDQLVDVGSVFQPVQLVVANGYRVELVLDWDRWLNPGTSARKAKVVLYINKGQYVVGEKVYNYPPTAVEAMLKLVAPLVKGGNDE